MRRALTRRQARLLARWWKQIADDYRAASTRRPGSQTQLYASAMAAERVAAQYTLLAARPSRAA